MHDLMTEEEYRKFRKNHIDSNIIATVSSVVNLSLDIIKWSTFYDKFVWDSTAAYSSSLSWRATLHSTFDRFFNECTKAPIGAYMIWRRTSYRMHIGEVVMRSMLDIVLETFYSGSFAFGYIQLTDRFGILALVGVMILFFCMVSYWYILYITLMLPYISEPLKDDEVGRNLKTLANGLGYPHEKIRITITDTTSKKGDVHYYRVLGYEMMIVTRRLLRILVPLQVTALVTKELGHWKFRHKSLEHFFEVMKYFIYCYVSVLSYGNENIVGIFGIDDSEVHPYLPMYLNSQYIWPIGKKCITGFSNLLKRTCVFQADDFASDKGLTAPLRSGLLVTAATLKNHPLYDSWHSAWFQGEPTIPERVARLNTRIPRPNVTFQSMSTVRPLLPPDSPGSSGKSSLESDETGEHSEVSDREKQSYGDDQLRNNLGAQVFQVLEPRTLHSDTDDKLLKIASSKSTIHRKSSDETQNATETTKSTPQTHTRKRTKESPNPKNSSSP
ncbi:hypothetical protein GE061_017880 [Apolygus lucorum]|uniref:Peptidase M48 domain-containing protein n=1 Tax=Apolygus lucorum TaxID=248454 RepID=A0A6A4JH96_APOLU|nr:hypothetical protein GE061_017880 [Apolygus lucorum]